MLNYWFVCHKFIKEKLLELILQVGNAKALPVDCAVNFVVVEKFLLNGVIFLDCDTLIDFSLRSTF